MKKSPLIRIGTLAPGDKGASYLKQVVGYGFESFQLTFWQTTGKTDFKKLAAECKEVLEPYGAIVDSLGVFGNPLIQDRGNEDCVESWKRAIDAASLFGATTVCGFAGRIVDRPIPESIPVFKKIFSDLAKRAEDKGVKIGFENCPMGGNWLTGDWNIAHNPMAWELMFNAVDSPAIGLEWEPCHQMCQLIDPIPQLRKWLKKIVHIHGKDANIYWDVVREEGIGSGGRAFCEHRTPGFGDSNWTTIISDLISAGYRGAIDIEGWHDRVYGGELEMSGQVFGLNYLKRCRADFIPNPV